MQRSSNWKPEIKLWNQVQVMKGLNYGKQDRI